MARAQLRADQIRDVDNLTEPEHASLVHENLVTSGTLNFQDGTISGTGDVYATTFYGDGSQLSGISSQPDKLYYSGNVAVETTADGIYLYDDTSSQMGFDIISDILYISNYETNKGIYLRARDSGDTFRNMITATPEGGVTLLDTGGASLLATDSLVRVYPTQLTMNGDGNFHLLNYDGTKYIRSDQASSVIKIQSRDSGSAQTDLIVADPDGSVAIYYDGSKVMETISDGIQVNDILEPSRVTEIKQNTDIFQIINRQHNGGLQIQCEDSNGTQRPLFYGLAGGLDPKVYLYAGAGVSVFATSDNGAEGGINIIRGSAPGTSGATVSINSNSKDFFLRNNYDGALVKIQGDSTAGTQVNMMTLDPHGSWAFASRNSGDTATNTLMTLDPDGAIELYYAGTKKVETTDYGLSFGANTISGTGDIYCNDIHTAAGSVYLGNLKLSSTDGETLLVNDEELQAGTASGTGASTFLELTDTPSSYTGTTGQVPVSTGSGINFNSNWDFGTNISGTGDIYAGTYYGDGSSLTGIITSTSGVYGGGWEYSDQTGTSAGTSVELITDLPSTVVEIEIMLNGVSTNTASQPPIIQLGDAGGYETTEYVHITQFGTNYESDTDAFYPHDTANWDAADVIDSVIRLTRWDVSENLWHCQSMSVVNGESAARRGFGTKTLSSTLTSIRLTTPGGSATFDAGEARIRYRRLAMNLLQDGDSLIRVSDSGNGEIQIQGDGVQVATFTADGVVISGSVTADAFYGEVPLPTAYINGLILSNGTDSDHDINISTGKARSEDDTANIALSSTMTKQIDATWAAGSDAGGLFSGSVAADTTYHVFAIRKDDGTVDAGFDTSVTASGIPSGYTSYRRIGSVMTDSSANITGFSQFGDEFLLKTPIFNLTTNPGTSAVLETLSVPTGIQVLANIVIQFMDLTPGATALLYVVTSPDQDDIDPAGANRDGAVYTDAERNTMSRLIRTNTSGQIRTRVDQSNTDIKYGLTVHGWTDFRGKQ